MEKGSDPMQYAYKETLNRSPGEQTGWLLSHIGPRITAAALGLTDARQLRRWRDEDMQPRSHEMSLRLPLLFRMAWAISSVYGDRTAALFLRSANPQLDDCAPLMLLRDQPPEDVQGPLLAAVEALIVN